jgi:hypothetical protein
MAVKVAYMNGFDDMMRSISSCHRDEVNYTRQVRLNWFFLRLSLLTALLLAGAGCSGINGGASVSPASFFLPGLLKNDTPTNAPALTSPISTEIATAR